MNERELSKLSYLTQALVAAPGQYGKMTAIIRSEAMLRPMSPDLHEAVNALERAFSGLRGEAERGSVERVAKRLASSSREPVRSAGSSLSWAIENCWPKPKSLFSQWEEVIRSEVIRRRGTK